MGDTVLGTFLEGLLCLAGVRVAIRAVKREQTKWGNGGGLANPVLTSDRFIVPSKGSQTFILSDLDKVMA